MRVLPRNDPERILRDRFFYGGWRKWLKNLLTLARALG